LVEVLRNFNEISIMTPTEEERANSTKLCKLATDSAKTILKLGDRLRVVRCPGTKRWVTFDHRDGYWIVTKSGIDDIQAINVDRVNTESVDFTTKGGQ
jgi:hypothetical protein